MGGNDRGTFHGYAILPPFDPAGEDVCAVRCEVCQFCLGLVEQGVLPIVETVLMITPSGRTREVINPFTGQTITREVNDRKILSHIGMIAKAAEGFHDYSIRVGGTGTPRTPPLPIDFDGPYYVGANCIVSSIPRSTSDLHEESGGGSEGHLVRRALHWARGRRVLQ